MTKEDKIYIDNLVISINRHCYCYLKDMRNEDHLVIIMRKVRDAICRVKKTKKRKSLKT